MSSVTYLDELDLLVPAEESQGSLLAVLFAVHLFAKCNGKTYISCYEMY